MSIIWILVAGCGLMLLVFAIILCRLASMSDSERSRCLYSRRLLMGWTVAGRFRDAHWQKGCSFRTERRSAVRVLRSELRTHNS